jgi:YVTN family beta-propeller protein
VTVIDCSSDTVIAMVTAGSALCALCYNPTNDKVFCANSAGNTVTVIGGGTNRVITSIPVGVVPEAFCHNPVQNRVYVANYESSTISVLRDSGGGVEESPKPQASSRRLEPTVLSGASGVRRLAPCVAFDAMGRRVANPRSGIYFVREAQAQAIRKVVITR